LIRPWAGQPGVASYTTGALTENDWPDNYRYKVKTTSPAASPGGVRKQLTACVTPAVLVEQQDVENAGQGTTILTTPSPTIDWYDFQTGSAYLDAFGFVFFWYHPGLAPSANNLVRIPVYWEIEFDIWSLKNPDGLPELESDEKGELYTDSAKFIAARARGENPVAVERPYKDVPQEEPVVLSGLPADQLAKLSKLAKPKLPPAPSLPLPQEDYVQVPPASPQ